MEVPLLLQFSIALFTGMVAATFVPPVRKAIPTAVEVALWLALITACVLGVMSVTDPNARNLSFSALWATDQVLNTIVGLMLGGIGIWISDHRFAVASWLVITAGADVLALMLLHSLRNAAAWQPRVRLREWMELPVHPPAAPMPQPVLADPLSDVNRKLAGASAVLGVAMLSRTLNLSAWLRNVMLPRELRRLARVAQGGRAGSRARLESVRDATAHLQFAARSWYAAAGEPAVNGVAEKATSAVRSARAAKRGPRQEVLRPGQVVDIQALLSAQSIGWYGPLSAGPPAPSRGEEDATESQRPDSLAS
ncbi:MAG: hypothetical protein E6J28_09190 [Chloroflexi bacterium]|nr:MAG: hypothetical protein E6J28_09190 [Chloroflexota bacterium]